MTIPVEDFEGSRGEPTAPDNVEFSEAVCGEDGAEALVREAGVPEVEPLETEERVLLGEGSDDSVVQVEAEVVEGPQKLLANVGRQVEPRSKPEEKVEGLINLTTSI